MSDVIVEEHPLTAFMRQHGETRVAAPGVIISLQSGCTHINVRIDPDDTNAVAAFTSVVSARLPKAGSVERGEVAVYWLGPKEFLVVSHSDDRNQLALKLNQAFSGLHAAATDLSGGQILLAVSGSSVRDFLSKASTLDLDEQGFAVNQCAQSTFAKAGALYALRSDDVFELVIRRSFADYAASWMLYAGQEFGIQFKE